MLSLYIEFLSFSWIFSSTSLEIFDIILCPPVRCVKKKLKRSQQRFSLFHGHGLVVFMHLHWHSTIQHVSSGSSGNFPNTNGAKWCKIQIHAVKQGMFQKPRIKHPMYYDEDIAEKWWKYLGFKKETRKIRYIKHVGSMREIDWGWLRMWGTLDIFSHWDPACCFGSPQYAMALDWTLNPAFV